MFFVDFYSKFQMLHTQFKLKTPYILDVVNIRCKISGKLNAVKVHWF